VSLGTWHRDEHRGPGKSQFLDSGGRTDSQGGIRVQWERPEGLIKEGEARSGGP
jgi:hypothetical protein